MRSRAGSFLFNDWLRSKWKHEHCITELAWLLNPRRHFNTRTGPFNAASGPSVCNTRQKAAGTQGEGFWGVIFDTFGFIKSVVWNFVLTPTTSICDRLPSKLILRVNKLNPDIIWVSVFLLYPSGWLGPDFCCFQRGYGLNRSNKNKLPPFTQMKNWWEIKGGRGTSNSLCWLEKMSQSINGVCGWWLDSPVGFVGECPRSHKHFPIVHFLHWEGESLNNWDAGT